MSEHDETCARCGEPGEDRRTLWMACLYEMKELGLPFEEVSLPVAPHEAVTKTVTPEPYSVTSYSADGPPVTNHGTFDRTHHRVEQPTEVSLRHFYTLRVCKSCRADWMGAIKGWFGAPTPTRQPTGTGVFIRRNGDTVEATEDEVRTMF
jgi:hypothetical protein